MVFKDLMNYQFCCDWCKEPFKDNTPDVNSQWGLFHTECKVKGEVKHKQEYIEAENEYYEYLKLEHKKDQQFLNILRRKLPPKIMEWIDAEIDNHGQGSYSIVDRSKCLGYRYSGEDYFGSSTPIRTVYEYSCNYSEDSYSGTVFLYIGKGRYFVLNVSG